MSTEPLNAEDLKWIVCPVCHQTLKLQPKSVDCTDCHRRYPLVDGIPVLLADRAL